MLHYTQPLPTSRHSKARNCVKYFLDIQNIKCRYRQNSYLTPFIEFDCRADIFSVYYSLVRTFMGTANSATKASGVWRGGGQVRSTDFCGDRVVITSTVQYSTVQYRPCRDPIIAGAESVT